MAPGSIPSRGAPPEGRAAGGRSPSRRRPDTPGIRCAPGRRYGALSASGMGRIAEAVRTYSSLSLWPIFLPVRASYLSTSATPTKVPSGIVRCICRRSRRSSGPSTLSYCSTVRALPSGSSSPFRGATSSQNASTASHACLSPVPSRPRICWGDTDTSACEEMLPKSSMKPTQMSFSTSSSP